LSGRIALCRGRMHFNEASARDAWLPIKQKCRTRRASPCAAIVS
jgi:hypothetical protein